MSPRLDFPSNVSQLTESQQAAAVLQGLLQATREEVRPYMCLW
jgi:hypothetical protein